MLETSFVGSLPKPSWLATPGVLWAPWQLSGAALAEGQRDAIGLALRDQEQAGLDVVTDGEQSRQHFIHTFVEGLEGVDFSRRVKKGVFGPRYPADVPTVVGPIRRIRPVYAEGVRSTRAQTRKRFKFALPAPMTIVETVSDEYYHDEAELAFAFAKVINEEARELEALGVEVIQLDEPAFNIHLDKVERWGIEALERSVAGLSCTTAVHICYGYGLQANIDWKHGLGAQWRQYERTFPLLANSSIQQVSLELANSRVPPELLRLLQGKDVVVGAVDIATEVVETPAQVQATLRRALEHVPVEHLCASTNCGLALLPRDVARRKLQALVAGTAQLRRELGG